jgi:hypothetical protein
MMGPLCGLKGGFDACCDDVRERPHGGPGRAKRAERTERPAKVDRASRVSALAGRFVRVSLLMTCVCVVPAMAGAQKVGADYDKDVDFSKFTTYVWRAGQSAPSPLTHKRIVAAIDEQLAAKGWKQSESSPGAIVVYHAGLEEERRLNAWGSGPRWNGFGSASAETILTGQLVVDIYDAMTGELVWRGFATDTATDNPEKNQKKIKDAVAKLFKQLPMTTGGKTK